MMKGKSIASRDYLQFVADLKARIQSARISAARAVNRDLILLYWDIGRAIVEKQEQLGWGKSVVEALARDLQEAYPQMRGFSAGNLWAMRRVYLEYGRDPILQQLAEELVRKRAGGGAQEIQAKSVLQQLVEEIPWGQHLLLLDKVKAPAARLYYLRATARFGWSRSVLLNQVKAKAYERAVTEKKTHNFPAVLPEYIAEQAEETLKSSYCLEFLGIQREVKERELEDRLIDRLQQFILELGYGFCFVGRQYRLVLGQKEYFVDLLFYHRFLKALVAFELKVGPFEPEYAGKMDFYLNLLNDKERASDDNTSIGIILCAEKDDVEVEYALRTKRNPIGVAAYQLQSKLPGELKGKLPTAKQLSDALHAALPGKGLRGDAETRKP